MVKDTEGNEIDDYKEELVHFNSYRLKFFSYYDAPDGQDLSGKLWSSIKASSIAAVFLGNLDAYMNPERPRPFAERFYRTFRPTVPLVGMACAFTIVTYYSTRWRNKDDPVNYFYGGVASGLFLGTLYSSVPIALGSSLILGLVGYAKKDTKMQGKGLFCVTESPQRRIFGPYQRQVTNWSIIPERPGQWSKEAPA